MYLPPSIRGRARAKFLFSLFLIAFPFRLSAQEFGSVTLLFAGDLMQHQAQIDAARSADGTYDYSHCFTHVKEEISRADLAIGNLEVTLAGPPYRGYPQFSAPDEYAQAIKDAGFDILLTANNHCLDRRRQGLERTLLMLDSLQIPHAGTYRNAEERRKKYPLIVERNGLRIALLNYTYGTNGIPVQQPNIVNFTDRQVMLDDIQQARSKRPDLIIACMHWGIEYRLKPESQERELAEWLISQGVDHVIGSHPHVVQPMELHTQPILPRQHLIVYSLGNYLSNMSAPNTDGGAMLKMTIRRIGHLTQVTDCRYSLVWTSRPALNRKGIYQIYPVGNPPKDIQPAEKQRMEKFANTARDLFRRYNIGVEEYFFK